MFDYSSRDAWEAEKQTRFRMAAALDHSHFPNMLAMILAIPVPLEDIADEIGTTRDDLIATLTSDDIPMGSNEYCRLTSWMQHYLSDVPPVSWLGSPELMADALESDK